MNMSFVLHLPRKMHLCRSSSNVPCPFWKCYKTLTFCSLLTKVHNPLRLPRKTSPERPKVVRTWCVLYILTSKCASRHNGAHFFDTSASKSGPSMVCFVHILTSKCASRHNGVHFFDISTSKSGPRPSVFKTFDFEMCFAPQRRALFCYLNF